MVVQVKKKAQITIPLKVRRILGVEEGDMLEIAVKDKEIVLRPIMPRRRRVKLLDPKMLKKLEGILTAGGDALEDSEKIYDR